MQVLQELEAAEVNVGRLNVGRQEVIAPPLRRLDTAVDVSPFITFVLWHALILMV